MKYWQDRIDEAHFLVRDHAKSKDSGHHDKSQDAKRLALRVTRKLWTIETRSESGPGPIYGERERCREEQR